MDGVATEALALSIILNDLPKRIVYADDEVVGTLILAACEDYEHWHAAYVENDGDARLFAIAATPLKALVKLKAKVAKL